MMVELMMAAADLNSQGSDSNSPPRILVVDDNEDAAHTLTRLLNVLGLNAVAAFNGLSAIKEIERCPPALVFLDLCMPEMDGIETAARIRQCPEGREVILVALTGLGQDQEIARSRQAGFVAHLAKPLSFALLESTLAEFVGYAAEGKGPTPK